ncbi:MAG TPA: hypothetical protein VM889_11895 [Candidatus Thermoplasmatota archaeon]|nr:hypothetical protein [Candidatus Thermoplasmatota archaeon]
MRSDWRIRALGALAASLAVPSFLLLDAPVNAMLAFAFGATGLFVALVVAERAVPASSVAPLLAGDARALADVRRGLRLEGRPVYVHDQGNVGAPRLFMPASDNAKPVPILDATTVAYAGTSTKIGAAVAPSGLALLAAHEEASGAVLAGASVADVESFLKGLAGASDLAGGVRVASEGETLVVHFRRAAVALPCFEDPASPACERAGCALCQAAGCALAKALARPVAVESALVEPPAVAIRFRPEGP